jgi:LysM repeat protein
MGLFGFDSVSDMFDGGGAGQSGDSYSTEGSSFDRDGRNDYTANGGTGATANNYAPDSTFLGNTASDISGYARSAFGRNTDYSVQSGDTLSAIAARNGTTVAALLAANPQIQNADRIQSGQSINVPGGGGLFGNRGGVRGAAPTGIVSYAGVGILGRLAGWANGLKPGEDSSEVVDGRQVYTSESGFTYSHNFLGLPYEVAVQDGKVVDALAIKGDDGLNGYERKASEARSKGDTATADAIMREAEDNATETEEADAGNSTNVDAAVTRYREIRAAAGIDVSDAEIEALIANPEGFMAERGLNLSDLVPTTDVNAEGVNLDPNDPRYSTSDEVTYDPTLTEAETVTAPNMRPTGTAITDTSADRLDAPQFNVDAATGTADADNLVDAAEYTLDMQGSATGVNVDGTTNFTGLALSDWASQDISRMVDTSTTAGKLLADKLGEGKYTDTKSTIIGQMDILSGEFKNSAGDPVIPSWAQGTYRNVQRSIAFTGMTGTAATAAAANAIMEATLPIAKDEAAFFQTLTIANLDNRQASILNKANTLAKFDMTNLSARENAAVQNAKTFLQFDMLNLENEQQAEVINAQARVDAMFTDVAEENVNRRLNISNEMENRQFYDTLTYQAATFNASAINATRDANAGRSDASSQFNINQTTAREQFEATMARSIDESNVGWRREVATTDTRMRFEASAADVRTAIGLTTEGMNRMWDRVDSQLDYIWRSTEADEQRDFELLIAEMNAAAAAAAGKAQARGSLWGSLIGGAAQIGAAVFSDERLKDNIQYHDTLPNGVNVYTWDWNDTAKSLGVDTPPFGVIAQEIMKTHPDAVMEGDDGYLRVNYGKIQ